MPSTLNGTRSDTKNFCKCGNHSAYHCRFMGGNYDYCQKKKGGKRDNAGRKPEYNEPTTTVSFRVPVSKVDVIAHIFSFLKGGEIFNNFSNENV